MRGRGGNGGASATARSRAAGAGGAPLRSIDPSTGELVGEYEEHADPAVDARLDAAAEARTAWASTPMAERAERMLALARSLEGSKNELATLMAREMGKPLSDGRGEIEKCAWLCRWVAESAERILADEPVEIEGARSYVAYRPLGTILAIMPWNFPFWQVFRCAVPALAAGNAALFKPAPNVVGCGLAIEESFAGAGFPPGLLAALLVREERIGAIVEDRRVAAVTLTGSVRAGRDIAARAGAEIKKAVLELGGSDPYLILADADLDAAADACVASRMTNSGQSCIAAKRFVVEAAVREAFEARLVERLGALRVGSPLDEATEIGPLAREDLRTALHDQVGRSVEKGGRLALGGELPEGPGWFYPPALLTDPRPGSPARDEELFGPVAVLIEARDEADAIAIANESDYGLGAAVFTRDLERGEAIAARELEAGCCFVNAPVRSDPRLPFGGVKRSGHGRELGELGLRELTNAKTVLVAGGAGSARE